MSLIEAWMEPSTEITHEEAEALLGRIAARDPEALGTFYDVFAGRLLSVARRVLNDAAMAEDVLQEVFVQIWERANSYDPGRGNVFTWAVVMTRNRAIDRYRSRQRSVHILERVAAQTIDTVEEQPQADPDRDAGLRSAVAELTSEQRTVIELAFFGGMTQSQIAEQLKKPLGTVKANIRRGMLKLRDRLQNYR